MHDQGGTKGLAAPVLVILHRIEQVLEHGPLKSHPVHMWTEGHQGSNHGLVGKRHQDGRAQPPARPLCDWLDLALTTPWQRSGRSGSRPDQGTQNVSVAKRIVLHLQWHVLRGQQHVLSSRTYSYSQVAAHLTLR